MGSFHDRTTCLSPGGSTDVQDNSFTLVNGMRGGEGLSPLLRSFTGVCPRECQGREKRVVHRGGAWETLYLVHGFTLLGAVAEVQGTVRDSANVLLPVDNLHMTFSQERRGIFVGRGIVVVIETLSAADLAVEKRKIYY